MEQVLATPSLRIDLLGPPEIRIGGDLVALSARKDIALLAILALAPGRTVSRRRLAGLLWCESEEARARSSLKQGLLRVRRAFAAHTDRDVLIADRQGVTLAPWIEVDAADLLAAEDPGAAERALCHRRGPLLDGFDLDQPGFDEWLRLERARVDGAFRSLALAIMRRAESAGRHEQAAEAARRLRSADPIAEEAVRLLMRWHAARGERGRALDLFKNLRDHLARELSVEPEAASMVLFQEIRRRSPPGPGTAPASPYRAVPNSIIVMPFMNIGDDLTQDYFAEGLAEDLATDLARLPGLIIASPGASARLRSLRDPSEAARAVGAAYALTGSTRRDEGRLRVTARLIEISTNRQVWADRYDCASADILTLQDQLSTAVTAALRLKLIEGGAEDGPAPHGTSDARAYEYYLKARSFHMRGSDARSLEVARVLYTRAIEADPRFARALAQLSICESHLAMGRPEPSDVGSDNLCLEHAGQALTLDPYLADAHAAMGLSRYAAGQYADADRALGTAMRLNPMLFEACFFQGRNRRLQGRRREAAELFERAAALRPSDYRTLGLLGEELQALGGGTEATRVFGKCFERLEGEVDEHPDNADALAFGAAVLADLGRCEQANEWASWALVLGEGQRLVHYNVARAWVMLERREDALAQLERAFRASPVVQRRLALWMAHDEDLAPLGSQPAFLRCLRLAS